MRKHSATIIRTSVICCCMVQTLQTMKLEKTEYLGFPEKTYTRAITAASYFTQAYPNENTLVTQERNGKINVWNKKATLKQSYKCPLLSIVSLLSKDSSSFFALLQDGEVCHLKRKKTPLAWLVSPSDEAECRQLIPRTFIDKTYQTLCIALCLTSQIKQHPVYLATGSTTGDVYLWSCENKWSQRYLQHNCGFEGSVDLIKTTPNGLFIVFAKEATITIWDVVKNISSTIASVGNEHIKQNKNSYQKPTCLEVPDNTYFLASAGNDIVQMWHINGTPLRRFCLLMSRTPIKRINYFASTNELYLDSHDENGATIYDVCSNTKKLRSALSRILREQQLADLYFLIKD